MTVFDVVSYRGDLRGFQRLQRHFAGPDDAAPPDAPWRAAEVTDQQSLFELCGDDGDASTVEHDRPATAVNADETST